jgi:hypothetical protein
MALSDDVKKVLDDLEVEKRLQEASRAIDRHAGQAVQAVGGYVAAREDELGELIERTAGQVDERTEGRWTEQIDKVRAGLHTGVAKLAEKKPGEELATTEPAEPAEPVEPDEPTQG